MTDETKCPNCGSTQICDGHDFTNRYTFEMCYNCWLPVSLWSEWRGKMNLISAKDAIIYLKCKWCGNTKTIDASIFGEDHMICGDVKSFGSFGPGDPCRGDMEIIEISRRVS